SYQIEEVRTCHARNQNALSLYPLVNVSVLPKSRPERDQHVQVFGVQLSQHLFGLRIMVFVELHCTPTVLAPVLPVLHQSIDRDFSLAELGRSFQNLLLAVISLSTLPIAIC